LQIDPALEPRAGELVVNKLSAGTFATTDLEDQLWSRGIDELWLPASLQILGFAQQKIDEATTRNGAS
jgi:hypothetical protein